MSRQDAADRGPRSDFARYAYGYSDKKPWTTILILTAMGVWLIWNSFS